MGQLAAAQPKALSAEPRRVGAAPQNPGHAIKMVDVVIVNDELPMLLYRLKLHAQLFARVYVFEAPMTFSGRTKPLHVRLNLTDAELKAHNVVLGTLPDFSARSGHFAIEDATRMHCWKVVTADPFVDDQTLIYISDVDELLDPAKARTAIEGLVSNECLLVPMVMSYYNEHCVHDTIWIYAVLGTKNSGIRPSGKRRKDCADSPAFRACSCCCHIPGNIKGAIGWHMSYHFDEPHVVNKLKAFSHGHQNFVLDVLEHDPVAKLHQRATACVDLFGRHKGNKYKLTRTKQPFGGFMPPVPGWPRYDPTELTTTTAKAATAKRAAKFLPVTYSARGTAVLAAPPRVGKPSSDQAFFWGFGVLLAIASLVVIRKQEHRIADLEAELHLRSQLSDGAAERSEDRSGHRGQERNRLAF